VLVIGVAALAVAVGGSVVVAVGVMEEEGKLLVAATPVNDKSFLRN
jgi:hypothetical protein